VAGEVRFFEHPEFAQAMLRAAEQFEVSEQFVEKDYYLTEILRITVDRLGDRVMLKGGTSLSKGWGLIARFSEDIDLFINAQKFAPPPGKNKMDRLLKQLAEAVGEHPALTWLKDKGKTIGGLGREDYFAYETHFVALPGIGAAVRLEPGVQSGNFPTELVPITSLIARYLHEQGRADIAEDLTGFDMVLLHYRRTFVEKMFALHGKVVRLQAEDYPLERDARHYPDLYVLAGEHEVRAMLASPEYEEIRRDYDEKSRAFFPKGYRPPRNLSFAASPALFPDPELRERLAAEYETQCRLLFSGVAYPSFDEVLGRFEEIRNLL
jgi:nucleotidyltransferase AbiEii toxin of type IV toxin-antitoxin system